MGEKDLALKEAERAIVILRQDPVNGPSMEETLAFIQTMFGERSRPISTLTQLLHQPFDSMLEPLLVTPALLRLDPIWDPLRGDAAFQKLCEEKQE